MSEQNGIEHFEEFSIDSNSFNVAESLLEDSRSTSLAPAAAPGFEMAALSNRDTVELDFSQSPYPVSASGDVSWMNDSGAVRTSDTQPSAEKNKEMSAEISKEVQDEIVL
jgi:hypothetical protein